MFKQICFFRKHPDMTMEEFMDYYENQHSTLAKRMGMKPAIPNAVRYVRRYLKPELNPVAGEIHDYHEALKELATQRLTEATSLVADPGEVEAVIVEKAPAHALVELADERDARVIVVGTRGEGPLRGALLGSTPHKLLQLSDRPVLVVPARE
jgi:nucleotide-binding universal stress UspA family protein